MDEISKSITKNIKNGQYFRDARNWYAYKYIYPFTERSLLALIAGIVAVALVVLGITIYNLFPIKAELPFIITVPDTLDYYSQIRPLGHKSNNPQQDLARYLVTDYVQARENYDYRQLEKQITRIRSTSTKQVFKKYYVWLSAENPDSPLLLYQKTIIRSVEVREIRFTGNEHFPDKAMVKFTATVEDRRKKEKSTYNGVAEISFTLSDINKAAQHKEPLEFIVTDYNSRKE